MYTNIKNMLVGIALAAVMAVAPVLAADESADVNALRSDTLSPMAVQERTELLPLSTEQLDSVKGGGATTTCNNNASGLVAVNNAGVLAPGQTCTAQSG